MSLRSRSGIIIISFVLIVLVSWGCTKKESKEEAAAPGTSPPLEQPHPAGWSRPDSHGVWVNQNTFEVCLACHKIESDQTDTSPTCFSCHPLYPHADGWNKPENHGAYVNLNGQGVCSTQCHGIDLGGGLSGVSCNTCHAIFPHPPGWSAPEMHGMYVIDNSTATCKTACHGTDLGGGTSGRSCVSCHDLYPHPTGWEQKAQHGTHVINNGLSGCRTRCHGIPLDGGDSNVSCDSCHPSYPHTDPNWATGAGHGACYSARYTSDSADAGCRGCHGAPVVFTDTKVPTGCDVCHFMHVNTRPSLSDPGAQTKDVLCVQSDCYTCHWAYPHIAYEVQGTGVKQWLDPQHPTSHTYFTTTENLGHIYYLMRSPLLTDSSDYRPWGLMGYDDPQIVPAVENTCGGSTSGRCHFDGRVPDGSPITVPAGIHLPLCTGYCHHPAP